MEEKLKQEEFSCSKTTEDVETSSTNYDEVENSDTKTEVKRALKPRHMSMIALGGTIGTGLFISTNTPLSNAGPVNFLIAYLFIASVVYSVTQSLGEMAAYIPITGSVTSFTTRFVSKSSGAASAWLYWACWAFGFPIELSIIGQIIEYWTFAVPNGAWIGIFFVILLLANLVQVSVYGEIEFWISSIKVVAIMGWIIYALVMVCGGSKQGPIGFRYWRNPGPWGDGILVSNVNTGRFLGWFSTLINAIFSYQGVELVGICSGECKNPRKTIPTAIRLVFYRILLFFILSIFFMGLLVPFNDPKLSSTESYVASSPFVIAIENCGTPVLPSIMNAVILATIISAGNSDIYIASRTLYSMAETGVAPKFLQYTYRGVPYFSVICTSLIGLLGFLALSANGLVAFNWLVNISATAGLFAWALIIFAHMRFIKALKLKGINRQDLPYVAAGMPYYGWYAMSVIIFLAFFQGFACFVGTFSVSDFFTAYISNICFVALFIFFQFYLFRDTPWLIPLDDIDLESGKREADQYDEEQADIETSTKEKFRTSLWKIIA